MDILKYALRKLITGLPLILGVTFISFVLMVHFGPDKTWELVGKNPSSEEIAEARAQLGYDRPFLVRYVDYLHELATLEFGHSDSTGERVGELLARTLPVSLALLAPGFVLGNVLGILLGLAAAWYRGRWPDRLVTGGSVLGMSISFLVVIIALQILLCTPYGLNWFPVRGWDVHDAASYLHHVTVPTLALVFVYAGYNTRFFRAVMVEEMSRDHVRTARAYGTPPVRLLYRNVLRNSLIPVITRILFSIPVIVISGSLLIENHFGIPGIGRVTFNAISSGDQPVLKAVVGMTAVVFVLLLILADILYRAVDPRVELE